MPNKYYRQNIYIPQTMRVIILNSTNVVQDGDNNKLVYRFPNSVIFKKNSIAVSSVSMYYSWFNIMAAFNNNTFSYTWTVLGVTTTYTMVLPNGLYEIDQINAFMQYTMITNGHYLIDSTGANVYFAEMIVNASRYAVQLNTYLIPTSLPATYVQPPLFAGYPTITQNPVITFPSKINEIFGYAAGFVSDANLANAYVPPVGSLYISKLASGTLSYISTTSPNVQPNSSVYFSLSGINNPYSQPSSIIYALSPSGVPGSLITEKPPNFIWNKLIDGAYNELRLTFLGTNLQPLRINDSQITIMLSIKDADETSLK